MSPYREASPPAVRECECATGPLFDCEDDDGTNYPVCGPCIDRTAAPVTSADSAGVLILDEPRDLSGQADPQRRVPPPASPANGEGSTLALVRQRVRDVDRSWPPSIDAWRAFVAFVEERAGDAKGSAR